MLPVFIAGNGMEISRPIHSDKSIVYKSRGAYAC